MGVGEVGELGLGILGGVAHARTKGGRGQKKKRAKITGFEEFFSAPYFRGSIFIYIWILDSHVAVECHH